MSSTMKTHSGASKRFKVTGSGKIKFKHAFMRHNQRKKTKKQKRGLRGLSVISQTDEMLVNRMLLLKTSVR